MVKAALTIAALTLSVPVQAQPPITFAEEFHVGNDVDLNQGFYVCDQAQAGVVLEALIQMPNAILRRKKAASMGCPFRLAEGSGPTYRVVGILNQVCKAQYAVRNPDGPAINCGREGHALAVERQGKRLTVIQLSLDISYD